MLLNIAYFLFCDPILPAGVSATEGNSLTFDGNCCHKTLVAETFVICVIVEYTDSQGSTVCFKSSFGFQGFFGVGGALWIVEGETTIVVNEDSGASVALLGNKSAEDSQESRGMRLYLVDGDTFSRVGSPSKLLSTSLHLFRLFRHCPR